MWRSVKYTASRALEKPDLFGGEDVDASGCEVAVSILRVLLRALRCNPDGPG